MEDRPEVFFLREMKQIVTSEAAFGKISCPVNKRSEMRRDPRSVPSTRLHFFLCSRTVVVIPPTSEFVYFLLLF